jgi:hypothetical protein
MPWTTEAEMMRIFGVNLLNQPELETLFDKLVGITGDRPLDCVGTIEELRFCLSLANKQNKCIDTYLMRRAIDKGILVKQSGQDSLLARSGEHCIPGFVYNQLTSELTKRLSA